MTGDARDFNNIETRAVIKEIHAILKETLGEYAPSYVTVKSWVAQFKRGDFSARDAPRPGWTDNFLIFFIFEWLAKVKATGYKLY
jgi:hypothetical protein